MEKRNTTRDQKPKPPDDIDGEALLEWERITEELEDAGHLDRTDRALITVYVRTWAVWRKAAEVVAQDGPIVLLPNNWPGQSPELKAMIECGKVLDKLLTSLGLTPTFREKNKSKVTATRAAPLKPLEY